MQKRSYLILNAVFILLFLGIFVYCYFLTDLTYQFKCLHQQMLGTKCPTCGLSRSFSSILHLNFSEASIYNPYGIRLFTFFIIQFLLRVFIIIWFVKIDRWLEYIEMMDGIISALLFMIFFYPFILSTVYLFYKMVLTGNQGV